MSRSGKGRWRELRDVASSIRAAGVTAPGSPSSVPHDDESAALYHRAGELAQSSIDDEQAREELMRLAGPRLRTRQRAEELSRLGQGHLEHAAMNRTHRLLSAVLNDTPVPPADAGILERIQTLDRTLDPDRAAETAWEDLAAREPRLEQLLRDVRARRFGPDVEVAGLSGETLADPELSRQAFEASRGGLGLMAELTQLVGGRASSSDPVISSERAYLFAYDYLSHQRPPS